MADSSSFSDQPSTPELDALVQECVDAVERRGSCAIDEFCNRHPAHAHEIRRRVRRLCAFGFLEPSADREAMPETIGPYDVVGILGTGGMGVVYRAHDPRLDRDVALKTLPSIAVLSSRARTRLEREARAVAQLDHENIVGLHGIEEYEGQPFLVMQIVPGCTLEALLTELRQQAGPAELTMDSVRAAWSKACDGQDLAAPERTYSEFAFRIALDVARALAHAGALGIIHRDVKPSNVMIQPSGRAQLFDFGLAHIVDEVSLTETGQFLGTARYSSPEQLSGKPVDARTDVCSLGIVLYELLTLTVPFDGKTATEVARQVDALVPRPPHTINPSVIRDAETVCLHAIEKDPARRYSDAAELAADLSSLLEYRPVRARPIGRLQRARRWAARHRAMVAAAIVSVVLVGGFGALEGVAAARRHEQALESIRSQVGAAEAAVIGLEQLCRTRGHDSASVPNAIAACRRLMTRLAEDVDRTGLSQTFGGKCQTLGERLNARSRDHELLMALDRALNSVEGSSTSAWVRYPKLARTLAACFQDYGLDLRHASQASVRRAIVAKVRAAWIRSSLTEGLNQLRIAYRKMGAQDPYPELCEIVAACHDDPQSRELYGGDLPRDTNKARALVDEVVRTSTDPLELSSLALAYSDIFHDNDRAVELMEDKLLPQPDKFVFLLTLARCLARRESPDWGKIELAYRAALAGNPTKPAAWIGLAKAVRHHRGDKAALPYYQQTVARFSNLGIGYYMLGFCYHNLEQTDLALSAYEKATDLDHTLADAHFQRSYIVKNRRRVLSALRAALDADPGHLKARHNLGELLYFRGDLQGAARILLPTFRLDWNQGRSHGIYGRTLAKLGGPDEALRHLRWAVELNWDPANYLWRQGVVLANAGRMGEASEVLWHALIVDPTNVHSLEYWAMVQKALGQPTDATRREAVLAGQGEPKTAPDWITRARVLSKQKKAGAAARAWERALDALGERAHRSYWLDAACAYMTAARESHADEYRRRAELLLAKIAADLQTELESHPDAAREVHSEARMWLHRVQLRQWIVRDDWQTLIDLRNRTRDSFPLPAAFQSKSGK